MSDFFLLLFIASASTGFLILSVMIEQLKRRLDRLEKRFNRYIV